MIFLYYLMVHGLDVRSSWPPLSIICITALFTFSKNLTNLVICYSTRFLSWWNEMGHNHFVKTYEGKQLRDTRKHGITPVQSWSPNKLTFNTPTALRLHPVHFTHISLRFDHSEYRIWKRLFHFWMVNV